MTSTQSIAVEQVFVRRLGTGCYVVATKVNNEVVGHCKVLSYKNALTLMKKVLAVGWINTQHWAPL